MDALLARIRTWVERNGTEYSHQRGFGGYRRDCAGMASFILGLPPLSTRGLWRASHEVDPDELVPGDLIISPGHHCAVFLGWSGRRCLIVELANHPGARGLLIRSVPFPYALSERPGLYWWTRRV